MYDAVVIGNVCLDIIPQFKKQDAREIGQLIMPGRVAEIGETVISLGGGVPNTGINLNRFGIKTALVGKIGDDAFGQLVIELLRQQGAGLADTLISTKHTATPHTVIINPPNLDRAFLHCPGATRTFGIDDVRFDLLQEARLLHFGYPSNMPSLYPEGGENLVEIFRRAKRLGAATSLDMAMPDPHGASGQIDWLAILPRVLPYVDIFTPSFEEILYMLDHERFSAREADHATFDHLSEDVPALASKSLASGARIVLIKCGTSGAYLRTAETLNGGGRGMPQDVSAWQGRELWAPAFRPARVAGTTGSGDAAIAGFLAAFLRGLPPDDTLKAGAGVGACSVEAPDSLSGIRDWDETIARIQAGWEQLPLDVKADGWRWDPGLRLWIGPHDTHAAL